MATNTNLRGMSETALTDYAQEKLAEARRLHEAARGQRMTQDKQRRFNALMAEANLALDERENRRPVGAVVGELSLQGWANDGFEVRGSGTMGEVRVQNDYDGANAALDQFARTGDPGRREFRAGVQSAGVNAQGGFLFTGEHARQLFEIQKSYNGLRQTRATRVVTSHGRDISWPAIDDTSNQASLVAEGSTISGTTGLILTNVTLEASMAQAGPILVSIELLEDSEVDVAGLVQSKTAQRIGRAQENFFTNRSSTESFGPHGFIQASSGAVAIGTAGSSNLTLDHLRSLFFSVDPAWRVNAEWQMSDAALEACADLTDGMGRPLLEPNAQIGFPNRLFGKPIVVNNSLAAGFTSGQKPIWFGDWSSVAIRDVNRVVLFRFNERYMHKRQIGFMAYQRSDSRPLFSSTYSSSLRPIRCIVV